VGFRPLHEFDTYTSIVACLVENATKVNLGSELEFVKVLLEGSA